MQKRKNVLYHFVIWRLAMWMIDEGVPISIPYEPILETNFSKLILFWVLSLREEIEKRSPAVKRKVDGIFLKIHSSLEQHRSQPKYVVSFSLIEFPHAELRAKIIRRIPHSVVVRFYTQALCCEGKYLHIIFLYMYIYNIDRVK